jgi:hypothetical protein
MADNKKKTSGAKPSDIKTLHVISTVIMSVSTVLLLLELFEVFKTYVGGVFLGVGFLIEGFARIKMEKAGEHSPQNKPAVVIGIGIFIILAGLVYLYIDLK